MSDDEHNNLIKAIEYYQNSTSYKGQKREAYIDGLNTTKALIEHTYLVSKQLPPSQKKQPV